MAVLFSDDFEDGTTNAWTSVDNTPSIVTNIVNNGTYALQCDAENWDRVRKSFTQSSQANTRAYCYFAQLPTSGNYVDLIEMYDSVTGAEFVVTIKNDGGTLKWGTSYSTITTGGSGVYSASPNPTTGIQYCVELQIINGATAKIFVDDAEVFSDTLTGTDQCNRLILGGWSAADALDIYIDDVEIADTYIGPLAPPTPLYPYIQQVSDVDSTADIGTHSAFANQQAAADSTYDTLTEANTGTPSTITRGATISSWVVTATTTGPSGTNFAHTVNANTTLLIVTMGMDADESVSTAPAWNTNETMTLIHATTSSANSGDQRVYTYGLINPTAKSDYITFTMSSDDHAYAVAVNYIGTINSSVEDATNYLNEKVNDSASTTTALASGGNAGSTLFLSAVFEGGDGDPSTNNAGFAELADSATGTSTTGADDAFYVADKIGGAPTAVTVDWYSTASDENAGHLIEILPVPNTNYRLEIEEEFTEVPYDDFTNWTLHVTAGAYSSPAEVLNVQVWDADGSEWVTLDALTASQDNTFDVTDYTTSAELYIRFKDGTVTNDSAQSTWQIDSVYLTATSFDTYTATITFDGVLQLTSHATAVFDGYLQNQFAKPLSFDGYVAQLKSTASTFDGYLQNQFATQTTFDGVIQNVLTASLSVDGQIQNIGSAQTVFDGYTQLIGLTQTVFDGYIQNLYQSALSFDGYLQSLGTANLSVDAQLQSLGTIGASFDGYLQALGTANTSFDGYLQKLGAASTSMDGYLLNIAQTNLSFDAHLQSLGVSPLTFDAYLQQTLQASMSYDAYLQSAVYASLTFDGVLAFGAGVPAPPPTVRTSYGQHQRRSDYELLYLLKMYLEMKTKSE